MAELPDVGPPAAPQLDKFRDLARKLRVNENPAAFEATVKRLATAPKSSEPPPEKAD